MKASILFFLFIFGTAFAGESSYLNPIGFSDDNKYFAYLEMTTWDGMGNTTAKLSIVDVEKNEFLPEKIKFPKNKADNAILTQSFVLKTVFEISKDLLAKYNFSSTLNYLKATKTQTKKKNELTSIFDFSTTNVTPFFADLRIQLNQPTTTENCQSYFELPCRLIDIKARRHNLDQNDKNATWTTLQKDKKLPDSRRSAYGYTVEDVFTAPSLDTEFSQPMPIVVMVRVYQPGFEGSSETFLPMTGIVK